MSCGSVDPGGLHKHKEILKGANEEGNEGEQLEKNYQ